MPSKAVFSIYENNWIVYNYSQKTLIEKWEIVYDLEYCQNWKLTRFYFF